MEDILARLTASAKILGIDVASDIFLSAMETSVCAFEDGRGVDTSTELGRSVLVKASVGGRSADVLTAA